VYIACLVGVTSEYELRGEGMRLRIPRGGIELAILGVVQPVAIARKCLG